MSYRQHLTFKAVIVMLSASMEWEASITYLGNFLVSFEQEQEKRRDLVTFFVLLQSLNMH